MTKGINYGQLMHKALRGLMAEVLSQVARDGLPGNHHFFITFDTLHPGVDMNPALKERYPKEMTIVLQEWFADLAVMRDRFTVTLNFGNVAEPIVVPFEAIKTFVDPSVEFGLRFDAHREEADEPIEMQLEAEDDTPGAEPVTPVGPATARPKSGDGEVVSLDKFRKH